MTFDLRRLDIYRKVPKDLTQPTLAGAIISIACVVVIFVLFCSELAGFLRVEIISQVYVDNPTTAETTDRIPVSIDIELPNLKCEYLGVDIQDDLGRHEVGFVDNTEKTPLNSGNGCRFHSTFQINKVPGNFHISTHSAARQPSNPDFSHKIRQVRFGDRILVDTPGTFNPLENVGRSIDGEDDEHKLMGLSSHDYIMKIVPTIYEAGSKRTISYQYTYAYRSFLGRGSSPAIWFRYDVSPLTVKYTPKTTNPYHFTTLLCAIIGGVFTIASMIDGILFSMTEFYKKFELNKLS
ncbi:endoplasmic reticulum-Golgi intermediate compartment protein 1 [Folsomia candida]|uniref:endoplasmic reticulum-Golgi intermediate compartment protein 1 n=1 Tax=Folsomia candida TaxID=158441 RepID=UPI000B906901|nr:endoplasmic reticulum-Golgi intermediate compartment protein 1 [Folsomia candida]